MGQDWCSHRDSPVCSICNPCRRVQMYYKISTEIHPSTTTSTDVSRLTAISPPGYLRLPWPYRHTRSPTPLPLLLKVHPLSHHLPQHWRIRHTYRHLHAFPWAAPTLQLIPASNLVWFSTQSRKSIVEFQMWPYTESKPRFTSVT